MKQAGDHYRSGRARRSEREVVVPLTAVAVAWMTGVGRLPRRRMEGGRARPMSGT
jgi:hypothetical protein